jgi:hypothetical protein
MAIPPLKVAVSRVIEDQLFKVAGCEQATPQAGWPFRRWLRKSKGLHFRCLFVDGGTSCAEALSCQRLEEMARRE